MKQILIIDDEEYVREMLVEMVEEEGYNTFSAANGKEGIKLIQQQHIDLVITDIIMPEQEGIETIFQLHRQYPNVALIAISGGGRVGPQSYLPMAKALGCAYTFEKPIRRSQLLKAIEKIFAS